MTASPCPRPWAAVPLMSPTPPSCSAKPTGACTRPSDVPAFGFRSRAPLPRSAGFSPPVEQRPHRLAIGMGGDAPAPAQSPDDQQAVPPLVWNHDLRVSVGNGAVVADGDPEAFRVDRQVQDARGGSVFDGV